MGGFLGSFFGGDQRRDVRTANAQATSAINEGAEAARGRLSNAMSRFDPYAETGGAAHEMYADALGVNGRGPQSTVVGNFMADPFREHNETRANETLGRQFAGRGMGNSGAFAQAAARGSLDRGSADYNQWLTRLGGLGSEGMAAAGGQASIDATGAQMEADLGNTRAGNAINFGNAMASSRNIGINNILGAAGTVIRAATPGFGGATALGNLTGMATSAGRGVSSAAGNGFNAMGNFMTPRRNPIPGGVGAYPY